MGLSASLSARETQSRSAAYIAAGLATWLCGVAAIALAALMIVLLAHAGWEDVAARSGAAWGADVGTALYWSAVLIGLALPATAALSLCAGVAASEPSIGGWAGRIVNTSLRAGPAVPSVAVGVAALATIMTNERLQMFARMHPIGVAAVALAVLNLPLMSARFRTVLRAVPRGWRTAAAAAGATPEGAFFRIVLPRAWPGVIAVILAGLGQMLGETAVVAIVLRAANSSAIPLSFDLWQRLAVRPYDAAAFSAAASETLLLVGAIVALRFAARVLLHRRRRAGALA